MRVLSLFGDKVYAQRRERCTVRELARGTRVRAAPPIHPPVPEGQGYSHKGFSVWNLKSYFEKRFTICRTAFSPHPTFGCFNAQAICVCCMPEQKKRPAMKDNEG